MTHTVALATPASSETQNKGTRLESGRTSHQFPCYFTGRWPQLQQGHDEASPQSRVPTPHSTTSGTLQKVASTSPSDHRLGSSFWQTCFNDLEAAGYLGVGSKVWSAAGLAQRQFSHGSSSLSSGTGSLRPLLDLWERRHLSRGVLREFAGNTELDKFFAVPAVSAALAQGRSTLASRCTFSSCSLVNTFFRVHRDFQIAEKSESRWHSSG